MPQELQTEAVPKQLVHRAVEQPSVASVAAVSDESVSVSQQETAARFIATLKRRKRGKRRQALIMVPWLIGTVVISLAIRLLNWPGGSHTASVIFSWGVGLSMLYSACAALWPVIFETSVDVHGFASAAGVYAIGPLIDSRMYAGSLRGMAVMYNVIADLLPRLNVENGGCLRRDHREFLYEVLTGVGQIGLNAKRQARLRLAAIEAMSRVGDARALKILRELARPSLFQRTSGPVQEAARAALPILEARLADEMDTRVLLRASAPVVAGSENLLRAASSGSNVQSSEILLRAAAPAGNGLTDSLLWANADPAHSDGVA